MEFNQLMDLFRQEFVVNRDKGTRFEVFVKDWLLTEPLYASQLEEVWLWKEFPYRSSGDLGIDLVGKTYDGEYWAIQAKFYEEDHVISKADVDTFLSASGQAFHDEEGNRIYYSNRFLISTTDNYNKNAEKTIVDQQIPVTRIGITDFLESAVDWDSFATDRQLKAAAKYEPRPHQRAAIDDVLKGFETNDRGKLIMACGTGKTFTSLRAAEELLKGKGNVLFLVPSIALVNQTLTEWASQCTGSFDALVVCSDTKASQSEDVVDLRIPSTTDVSRLKAWVNKTKEGNCDYNFVFSTYQSIEKVAEMQKATGIHFDLIVCDEAHRTTGVTLSDEDDSHFVKVHDNNFIQGDKRLYMTATPRIFGDAVKGKAKEVNAELCSMDDETKYGPVFHNLTFSEAVKQNLLTDYKVLILAIDEEYVKAELQDLLTDENHELRLDDTVKIMGCWKGLSKVTLGGDKDDTFITDPQPMKRAVAFCNRIADSKNIVDLFATVQDYVANNDPEEFEKLTVIDALHVDGGMNAAEKKKKISWLKDGGGERITRILSNARCLSEGVDVPALDAVMFLNPRSSLVDIIQSVGRVMRKADGKKFGYVILPIGVSADEDPATALDNNEKYKLVWEVLQALRSHDDRFNNTINKIDLNKKKPSQIQVVGIGSNKKEDEDDGESRGKENKLVQGVLNLDGLEKWRDAIYAKMVKKVGSRRYWETWGKDVARIAQAHSDRIRVLLGKHDPNIDTIFHDFVAGLQNNLNPNITEDSAIDMLAQHMVTKPVFDALFDGYEFVKYNPVSITMEKMMQVLDSQALDSEKEKLEGFYESVRERAAGIDNAEGKQKIVKELYDTFFQAALPLEADKLGTVYTPIECVDFVVNSVEKLMAKYFNASLGDQGVHILDGFTGTGSFVTRLLQSGVIPKEKMLQKYDEEIHANEISLLAYYIAAINIEETLHDLLQLDKYVPFDGIVLTDTFQLYEEWKDDEFSRLINEQVLPANSARAEAQRKLDITVAISNPPWRVGSDNQNVDAQNMSYPHLDQRISETYAQAGNATLKRNLYDMYIKAFRWASDRIKDRGIVGFVTNGSFIDGAAFDGFRKTLTEEFNSVYVYNLRGDQRTKGEESRREGGKIFGSESRAPTAITFLIKTGEEPKDGYIHYCDIGDYLTTQQKLQIIKEEKDVDSIEWINIYPDSHGDWLNKKSENYDSFYALIPEKNFDDLTDAVFTCKATGISTNRDAWVYGYSRDRLIDNLHITYEAYKDKYDHYQHDLRTVGLDAPAAPYFVGDEDKLSWTRGLKNKFSRGKMIDQIDTGKIVSASYRPFCRKHLYYNNDLVETPSIQRKIYQEQVGNIPTICVSGGSSFTVLVTDTYSDLHFLGDTKALPLYTYELTQNDELVKLDGITDTFHQTVRNKYGEELSKEDIFYYIYGLLNSEQYTKKYRNDLSKDKPRVPLVKSVTDFKTISSIGKELADIHLSYEKYPAANSVVVTDNSESSLIDMSEWDRYGVRKMCFAKKKVSINGKEKTINNKSTIMYNDRIAITEIPDSAYEYMLNGRSAIEWIMEMYQVKIDKKSQITSDPNDWSRQVNNPRYILELLLSVIALSVETVELRKQLPEIKYE